VQSDRARAWSALEQHARELAGTRIDALFEVDPDRAADMSASACGLYLDYSKQRITARTRELLLALAQAAGLAQWRERMFAGEPINATEARAALHVALRWPPGEAMPGTATARAAPHDVEQVLARIAAFCDEVRAGRWTGFSGAPMRDIVNIGIGGSDLGPAMACRALQAWSEPRLRCHFVSNVDSTDLACVLAHCDPRSTLFIVASKTFSTQETLLNARSARAWLVAGAGGDESVVDRHFVAVSTALDRCAAFGIPERNVFGFWDWVGGRYSLWSAIGLSIALYTGMDTFRALQRGAHAMDRHFLDAPAQGNLPLLLGLVGVWNRNLLGCCSHAVLPYDHALALFPAYLQQLEMESNGKGVDRAGAPLQRPAAPVIWGTLGNNGQHAFYQMMHQGLDTVPADIIVPALSQHPLPGHEDALVANALAQAEAFMRGRTLDDARASLAGSGLTGEALARAARHRVLPGNRASSVLLYRRLTPELLGALVALYEHKVFVQAVCWDINPFDQFGVELGKAIAKSLQPLLEGGGEAGAHDPSTRELVARVRTLRAER
jgi:glucose-6-phosphate isomerase